jgi:hypothetical protein
MQQKHIELRSYNRIVNVQKWLTNSKRDDGERGRSIRTTDDNKNAAEIVRDI